jgi:hypothetical protein
VTVLVRNPHPQDTWVVGEIVASRSGDLYEVVVSTLAV